MSDSPLASENNSQHSRRRLLSISSSSAMLLGLIGGYGTFAWIAARFLYPARGAAASWMFVREEAAIAAGETLLYRTPAGATVNITRRGTDGSVEDFIALSSVCPHLGCQVHWESQHQRYFCPCHNGTFAPDGRGTGGPPGDAGLSLPRYPLKIENGLLYIEAPVDTLAADKRGEVIERAEGIHGPGHDPCLARLNRTSRQDAGPGA